jgi:hypothetical protein
MKWVEKQSATGRRYTALVTDDEGRELGSYYHERGGFVPASPRNNARPRVTENEARRWVVDGALDRMKRDMAELGWIQNSLVPRGTIPTERHAAPAVQTL